MNRFENRFTALAAGRSANGAISAQSLVAAGTITVFDGGSGFAVVAGVQNNSAAPILLRSAGNLNFSTSSAVSGSAALEAGGTLTLSGSLASSATIDLTGGAITVSGSVQANVINGTAGGLLALSGGNLIGGGGSDGAINLTSASLQTTNGSLTAQTMTLRANGGTASLSGTRFTAGGTIDIRASGGISADQPIVSADAMQLRTPGAVSLTGGNYTIGRVLVFAGFGGITTNGTVVLRPRNTGTFPGLVFDTRAPGNQFDPLTLVRADTANVAASLQPTQVRKPNVELPGDFGPGISQGAGSVVLNVDALQSPLFLLIDGGSARGVLNTSGRVGIVGVGGVVNLTGVVVDTFGRRAEGQASAALADAVRPILPQQISRFRINDCVVSSFNCVVPSTTIVLPNTVPAQPPLIFGAGGRDPDAVAPNVAEEWSIRDDQE